MAGLIYDFSKSLSLYCSVGHGFSNPTVEESLNSQGMMNAGLKPEKGWTIDLGFKSRLAERNFDFAGSVYIIYLNDLLVTKRPAEDLFYGENAGNAVLKGLEIALQQRPFNWLSYNFSANLSDNRFRNFTENNISYTGKKLPGIPLSQLYADCEITLPSKLRINTAFRSTGIQFADDANLIKVGDWETIDAGIRYETKLTKKLHLHAQMSVNNLCSEHYASMILINAPSFGGREPRYYYPAQSRNFALNIKLKWD
jgi:iron complex outermembrane receptor protein